MQKPRLKNVKLSHPTKPVIPTFSPAVMKQMKTTLKHFSSNDWYSDHWDVYVPVSKRSKTIRFPKANQHDCDILKAAALLILVETGSPEAAQRIVRDGSDFFQFLMVQAIRIENISTSTVKEYIKYLEETDTSCAVVSSRVRSAKALFDTCIENDLVKTTRKVVFDYKSIQIAGPRRPPDKCVIDSLDRLVFNLPDGMIPLTLRTLYIIARMIPSRISELLALDTNCLVYPDKGLYSIKKPTSKETPLHAPIYKDFTFDLNGKAEAILHRCISDLIARSKSADDLYSDVDYLFYDKEKKRVLNDYDFNEFLALLIATYKIRNEDGSYPKVTSHTFRHASIGDRLNSGIYSVAETAEEAGHTDPDVTLSYGYPSKNDEAKKLNKIVEEVMNEENLRSHFDDKTTQRVLNASKYARLQTNTPYIRLIPIIGACDNSSCTPQYAECINCDAFQPDPIFLKYFVAVREIITKRLERLSKGGAEEAIIFEEYELEIVEKYIKRIDPSFISDSDNAKGVMVLGDERAAVI